MSTRRVVLETRNLCLSFGGLKVIDNLNLKIEENEIRCIIGPNGAGKTTLFNVITGALRPDSGDVYYLGQKITGKPPYGISSRGLGRKFQSPNIFYDLTVADNLRVAAEGKSGLTRLPFHVNDPKFEDDIAGLLKKIGLSDKARSKAADLSHGQKQWLEIGMVLANRPSMLLLDEPTAGMTIAETKQTVGLLRDISANLTTLMIEHDIPFVREIAEKITVLHRGAVLCEGCLADVENNADVRAVYLGTEDQPASTEEATR
jgi:urea transport system ATP-binding protein